MGYFRLLLASLVVVSHMGISLYGHNPGVFAVAIFYLLAGQVVVRLWLRMPGDNWLARCGDFYRDRLLRIAPMYMGMLCIGVLAWYLGAQSWFVSATPDVWAWLGNILIVPLNYYMYNGADQFTLLPPAWSLAAEIQFYLLVPLLLASARLLVPAFVMSLVVFFCAQQGWLNTDIFGYRLLPGVLFIFLSGGLLELHRNARLPRAGLWLVIGCWLAISLWAGWLLLNPSARAPYNLEVALGYALGLPVVQLLHLLRQRRRHASVPRPAWRTGSGQQLAGVLSYGVFLVHFPVIWLLELFRPGLGHSVPVVILLSMLLALLVHFALERPLWHRLRLILVTGSQ